MNSKLQLKDLVKKTVLSLMIPLACRKQALFTIIVDNIVTEKNKLYFCLIKPSNTAILIDH